MRDVIFANRNNGVMKCKIIASQVNRNKVDVKGCRDVIGSRQIDKSTFSLCQLNRIEWLGIELK